MPDPRPLPNYTELVNRLMLASEHLNTVSDAFNDQIQRVETGLNDLKPGVACVIGVVRKSPHGLLLGYGRFDHKWHIYVVLLGATPDKDEEWILTAAPRSLRISAADALPWLIAALVTETCTLTTGMLAAGVTVHDYLVRAGFPCA